MGSYFSKIDDLMVSLVGKFKDQVIIPGTKELTALEDQLVKDFVSKTKVRADSVKDLVANVKRMEYCRLRMNEKLSSALSKLQ